LIFRGVSDVACVISIGPPMRAFVIITRDINNESIIGTILMFTIPEGNEKETKFNE
jgi:hypothetical protein